MTDDKDDDATLTPFFDASRAQAPAPSADLMARVLADARAEQPTTAAPVRPARPARGRLATVFDALGGWPAMAGLTAATVAGVWIGVNPPAGMADQLAGLLGTDQAYYVIDLDDGAGLNFLEGSS